MKTIKFLQSNCLAAVASLVLAIPAQAEPGRGGNGRQAAAPPARVSAPVRAVAPSARFAGAPRVGSGARLNALGNRSFAGHSRFTGSGLQPQLAQQRAFQNAAAARALNARDFRASRFNSSRSFADFRDRSSGSRWNGDWRHDRDWWWHHHRHDRVVFIDGGWVYNPFYYDFYNGYYPDDYYYDEPAPVYYDASADDSVVVEVQRELRREGYYRGPIDGLIGPGTRQAIAAYQRDNGLAPTGRINGSLLDSMGLT